MYGNKWGQEYIVICVGRDLQMKTCQRCKIEKPISEFTKVPKHRSKDGLYSYCKKCAVKLTRECRYKTPERHDKFKKKMAIYNLKKFNLTPKDYDKMLESQNNVCLICGNAETRTRKGKPTRLSIDHCHISGKVRGLLCSNCNSKLGWYEKCKEKVENYLKSN